MLIYLYDGTFEGLLTAIYQAYYRREKPDSITTGSAMQTHLFGRTVQITTDSKKAEKVSQAVREKISPAALSNILFAFLSEQNEATTWVYHYLDLGWKMGKNVDLCLNHNPVLKILDLARKVKGERHRMLGLIRFRRLNLKYDIYYAPYKPDYNITGLVAPHFARRLADQNWIIHDTGRNLAALFNQKEWLLTEFQLDKIPSPAANEETYQKLWKNYFNSVTIKERYNPKLQKQNMPMKYWRYLIEKN
ncbi:MAG: TIGR03915 family putative DNA repair protein [Desulfitobacteriaceae bacterium]|nr:TIGR03915 family putative DNA repair protein [Desulfitobacteriaceae bacterium]MDD4753334.1 TIGR03915 family putative DNA repair protein [Desulfitobacteriaceae bacterium]